MINFLKTNNTEEPSGNTVSVANDHLVISLTDTDSPTIWRMSLDDIGSSVFSIKKEKTKSKLILKQKDGSKSDKEEVIASFKDHDEATSILSDISNNLLNPKKSKFSSNSNAKQTTQSTTDDSVEKKKWGIALLLVFVIIGLYIYLTTLMPENMSVGTQTTQQSTGNTSQGSTGQVIDADEFLKGL